MFFSLVIKKTAGNTGAYWDEGCQVPWSITHTRQSVTLQMHRSPDYKDAAASPEICGSQEVKMDQQEGLDHFKLSLTPLLPANSNTGLMKYVRTTRFSLWEFQNRYDSLGK